MDILNIGDDQYSSLLFLTVFGIVCIVWMFYLMKSKPSEFGGESLWSASEYKVEVIIVGSGIVGSALAAVLARDGRRVTVIERDLKEPNRIVGELLQPGGCKALKILGLQDCLEGIDAQTVLGYVLHDICNGASVNVPYPQDYEGIQGGRAFHHGRFVMALRKAAMEEPNVTYIEGTVNKVIEENGTVVGVSFKSNDSDSIEIVRAPLTVVADGCFSRLRKDLVKALPETKSNFIGMLMENCPLAKVGHAELLLSEPCPILVYQISSTHTRMLVDVRNGLPRDIKTYMKDNIYAQLPEHLKEPFLEAVEHGHLRSMPNNFLPPAPVYKRGVMCLGDALNMRHPLTGGGMSVAFCDIVLCRQFLKGIPQLGNTDAVLKAAQELYLQRKNNHSFVVNILSMALYELFAANDEHAHHLKEACIRYFQMGGECVAGPVALLSILKPKPLLLVAHFFAVAFYATYLTFRREPVWAFYRSSYNAICVVSRACGILFPLIWSEVKFNVTSVFQILRL